MILAGGATLKLLQDGSILPSSGNPDQDTYHTMAPEYVQAGAISTSFVY